MKKWASELQPLMTDAWLIVVQALHLTSLFRDALTVLYIYTRRGISKAASAQPGGLVITTWALLGHHTSQTALETDRHLVNRVQVPVVQHPPEFQLTYSGK